MTLAISRSRVEEEKQQRPTNEAAGSSVHTFAGESGSQAEVSRQEGNAIDKLQCPICLEVLAGAPCNRPDGSQSSGGWGYVGCCAATFHFECLGHWLKVSGNALLVESTRDLVDLDLGCPHCRAFISTSSTRMLQSEV
jgi:hypothetical protein